MWDCNPISPCPGAVIRQASLACGGLRSVLCREGAGRLPLPVALPRIDSFCQT